MKTEALRGYILQSHLAHKWQSQGSEQKGSSSTVHAFNHLPNERFRKNIKTVLELFKSSRLEKEVNIFCTASEDASEDPKGKAKRKQSFDFSIAADGQTLSEESVFNDANNQNSTWLCKTSSLSRDFKSGIYDCTVSSIFLFGEFVRYDTRGEKEIMGPLVFY